MTRKHVLLAALVLAEWAAWPCLAQNGPAGDPAASAAAAASDGDTARDVSLWNDPAGYLEQATKPEKLSSSLEILLILTVLSLAPAILIMTTCFTRIVVVLALLRQAMATNQLPPAQVITGLALFMTLCVMAPTWQNIYQDAIAPYSNPAPEQEAIGITEVWGRAQGHLRSFMITQIENTGNSETVYMFVEMNASATLQEKIRAETLQWRDVPLSSLIPAFVTSELKQAFVMGFYIYLPFLIIDMVIASILMSMGMMMLPPVLISLPFKLLLFVLVDGWRLVVGSLLHSFTNNLPVG
ncbi:MAG: flagellar type III secretion system pore protein FliP [Sedimentisphaerales bacterium]|nr:flagellar type III secretion system pore protein FliP [Sedimentisphaerales bacterium]